MPTITPSIATWNRLEPRPRTPEAIATLRAEIRDPAWLLGRQWQFGEFNGEDAGSPAFVEVTPHFAPLQQWSAASPPVNINTGQPLERQALAEPLTDDVATRVEIGQLFFGMLRAAYGGTIPDDVASAFAKAAKVPDVTAGTFDPIENTVEKFLLVVGDGALDGVQILTLAQQNSLPSDKIGDADAKIIRGVYQPFLDWVTSVFGAIGPGASPAWDGQHLDNHFLTTVGTTATPNATLVVQPDADGRLEWSSFDLQSQGPDPFAGTTAEAPVLSMPAHVRFPGMPANRYWDFEEGKLALPDIDLEQRDPLKLLVVNFVLVSGLHWFVLPLHIPVV